MLRLLIPSGLALCLATSLAGASLAEEAETPPAFAPGVLGNLGVDVDRLRAQSLRDADLLRETLQTQAPADLSDMSPGIQALQENAMNDPRIRTLLGLEAAGSSPVGARPDHSAAQVLVFASFGMPDASLRQVMQDAERYQAQVVFRGFLRNSVFETEASLKRVFGSPEAARGFAIDPTLFTRFEVQAVPVYVVLNGPVDVCETPGCAGDVLPPHDRISGNITLEAALSIAVHAKGDASKVAEYLLAAADRTAPEGLAP